MNVDVTKIVKLLFPNGNTDEWLENPDFSLYLAEIGSYSIERACIEPDRIAEQKASLLEQTQELAFSNYKTFIQTASCSRDVFKKFSAVEERLSSLVAQLPEFSEKCHSFSKIAQDINSHRRLNSLTLRKHPQLLEILELPQLMESCVRNGFYEEALELGAFTKRLEKKHGSIPVVGTIVQDVQGSLHLMLSQLLAQLRTNIQLPMCLKIIGYLRRMDVFSEAELRLKFLQARNAWLQGVLTSIPKDDPYHHVTKTVELSRVHLFDIATQYRAIFSDGDGNVLQREPLVNESAIFYGWIIQRVNQFLRTLETDIGKGVGSSLDSLLGQCMYFGLSFGRVGADFRPLLGPIFAKAVVRNFEQAVNKTDEAFEMSMEHFTLMKLTSSKIASYATNFGTKAPSETNLHPPLSLMEFTPLAEYCNGLLVAMNELRVCAPLCTAIDISRLMQQSMERTVTRVLAFLRQEQQAFTDNETDNFKRFCACIANELFPYLKRCFQALFPVQNIAALLGTNIQEVQKENLLCLDLSLVLEPLKQFLPEKIAEAVPETEDVIHLEDTKEDIPKEVTVHKNDEEVHPEHTENITPTEKDSDLNVTTNEKENAEPRETEDDKPTVENLQ